MIVSIQHEIAISYSSPVSESVMDLRLTPLTGGHQTLREFKLVVGPKVPLFDHFDWQDNRGHHFSIVGSHDRSIMLANSTIEIHPQRWQLDQYDDLRPMVAFDHRYTDFLLPHGPVQFDSRLKQLASEIGLGRESRMTLAIAAVMSRLQSLVTFNKLAATPSDARVSDVLTRGEGNAQDCAHVALSMLRQLGIPARYVSGYLFRYGMMNLDSHAWVEAFVPSAGWIGIDPTRGQLIGTGHISLAIGRSELDARLRRGAYRGDAQQSVKQRVRRVDYHMDCRDPWFGTPQLDNQLLVETMLRDRVWTKESIEQQIFQ